MVNNQGKTDSPTGVEADLWAQELDKNKELDYDDNHLITRNVISTNYFIYM